MLLPVSLATLTNASHSSNLGPRNVSVVVGAAFVTWTAPTTSTRTSALTELRPNQRGSSRNSITLSPPLLVTNVSYRDFRFRFQNSSPKSPSPGFRLAGLAPTDENLFGSSRTPSTRHKHPCGRALFLSSTLLAQLSGVQSRLRYPAAVERPGARSTRVCDGGALEPLRLSILRLSIRFGIVAPFVLVLGVALARGCMVAALKG